MIQIESSPSREYLEAGVALLDRPARWGCRSVRVRASAAAALETRIGHGLQGTDQRPTAQHGHSAEHRTRRVRGGIHGPEKCARNGPKRCLPLPYHTLIPHLPHLPCYHPDLLPPRPHTLPTHPTTSHHTTLQRPRNGVFRCRTSQPLPSQVQ